MNEYSKLVSFDAENAIRTFEHFYEYHSVLNGEKYMCFESTVKLTSDIVAAVNITKYMDHVHFFSLTDFNLSCVIFSTQDEGFINIMSPNSLVIKEYATIHDIEDSDLEYFELTRENLNVLYNLKNDLLKILKKDEMIKNIML